MWIKYVCPFLLLTSAVCAITLSNDADLDKDGIIQLNKWQPPNYQDIPRPCPCSDLRLCQRVVNKPEKEVFTFTIKTPKEKWMNFDWTKVTTVIPFEVVDDELMCYAHSQGVRVLFPSSGIHADQLTNATARTEWVVKMLNTVVFNFLDGINLDFEQSIAAGRRDLREGLTEMVRELNMRMMRLLPTALITGDFPWTPNGYGRFYDYKAIIDLMDFMVIMDYDEPRTNQFSLANSGYTVSRQGVKTYMKMGITPDKIVMAFPWYGYYYSCKELNETTHQCHGAHALKQVSYDTIVEKYLPMAVSGRLWDDVSKSPFLDLKTTAGASYQLWYDDPISLSAKYRMTSGLRGTGMWHATAINYSDPVQVQQMWAALP